MDLSPDWFWQVDVELQVSQSYSGCGVASYSSVGGRGYACFWSQFVVWFWLGVDFNCSRGNNVNVWCVTRWLPVWCDNLLFWNIVSFYYQDIKRDFECGCQCVWRVCVCVFRRRMRRKAKRTTRTQSPPPQRSAFPFTLHRSATTCMLAIVTELLWSIGGPDP